MTIYDAQPERRPRPADRQTRQVSRRVEETTQVNCPLPVPLYRRLKLRAAGEGRPMKDVVRDAVERYLADA